MITTRSPFFRRTASPGRGTLAGLARRKALRRPSRIIISGVPEEILLLDRIKSGRYRAPPVRRAYIPKADGSQSMLGIPTFEDKVAQRVVTMVLEEIYEQDFLSCSYGFRPGRSAHQALRTLQNVLWAKRLYWVLDIDIRKYFDSISHPTFERS